MQKNNQKGRDTERIGQELRVDDAHLKIVGYTTTNPGDSHRPGRTTEITND